MVYYAALGNYICYPISVKLCLLADESEGRLRRWRRQIEREREGDREERRKKSSRIYTSNAVSRSRNGRFELANEVVVVFPFLLTSSTTAKCCSCVYLLVG